MSRSQARALPKNIGPEVAGTAGAEPVVESPVLRFRIVASRPRYTLGEPVSVHAVVENNGTDDVVVPEYLLLPSDDSRNNIRFAIETDKGERIVRRGHVLTAVKAAKPLARCIKPGQRYVQAFQLAGTFRRKNKGRISVRPLWAFGDDPSVCLANEYPTQKTGRFRIRADYRNDDDGRLWVSAAGWPGLSVWTGGLESNTVEIEVVERRGR